MLVVSQARTTATVTWRGSTASVTTASVNTDTENTASMEVVEEGACTTETLLDNYIISALT